MAEISLSIVESRTESLRQLGRPARSLEQHRQVAEAVRSVDTDGAARAMHIHIETVGHAKPRVVATAPAVSRAASWVSRLNSTALLRCLEAADLPLEQFGEPQRGAVLEHRTDELHSHRQTLGGPARWYGGGG